MNARALRTLAAVFVLGSSLAAAGCSDDDDEEDVPPPPPPPAFMAATLVSNAGEDLERGQRDIAQNVSLDGTKSIFRPTPTTTRLPAALLWELLPGAPAPLTISDPTDDFPSVALPPTPTAGTYTFRLTVTEGGTTDSDTVDLVVKPFIINQIADKIRIGFAAPGLATPTATFAATVTGTSGALSFSWTGIPAPPFVGGVTGANTATLVLSAPFLSDVQFLPPQPSVIGMWLHAGGYTRLTLTATDGVSTDTEDVVVSFGQPTSGLTNVALGTPVYLNGGTSGALGDAWTWTIVSAPLGGPTFFTKLDNVNLPSMDTSQQVVFFTPTIMGLYTVLLERQNATGTATFTTQVVEINVAQYVGDGLTATVAPNPDLGNCAGCHGGSIPFLEDKVTPYKTTKHSAQAQKVFDPANATVQARLKLTDLAPELSRATTGFYLSAASGGFDDVALSKGLRHKDATYDQLVVRSPETMMLSQIQCETCHGPGSLHFGDSEAIALSFSVDSCARCHRSEPAEWANSEHRAVVSSPSTNTSCVRCHTAVAAADDRAVEFQYSTDPVNAVSPPSLSVPDEPGRRNTATCVTCHDPHSAANHVQLRVVGDQVLPDGTTVPAGDSGSCFHCHNSRVAILTPATVSNRSAMHNSAQGDMFAAVNGAEFPGFAYPRTAHSDPNRFKTPSGTPGRYCLGCHMVAGPPEGDPNHDFLGEHTFRLRSAKDGTLLTSACNQCHSAPQSLIPGTSVFQFNRESGADWDGDGKAGNLTIKESYQEEVATMVQRLGGAAAISPSNPYAINSNPAAGLLVDLAKKIDPAATGITLSSGKIFYKKGSTNTAIPATPDGDVLYRASWNYYYVRNDASMGAHNTGYTVSLLQASIVSVETALNVPPGSRFAGAPYVPK